MNYKVSIPQVAYPSSKSTHLSVLPILAHGESWEIAASHAITNIIEKYLSEYGHNRNNLQENGTFELHYVPANAFKKSFTIPLTTHYHPEANSQNEDNNQLFLNVPKAEQNHYEDLTARF